MDTATTTNGRVTPWNKGKLLGQKPPLKLKEIWAIRIRLQLDHRTRELALFNLAIDSKLRGCDPLGLRVYDVGQGSHVAARAIVMQKKTQRPVQFEITEQTRDAVLAWVAEAHLKPDAKSARVAYRPVRLNAAMVTTATSEHKSAVPPLRRHRFELRW